MVRKAFLMTVAKSAHDDYRRRHDAIWPEMRDTLEAHGVHNYSIYLDPQRSLLFAYVELDSLEQWDAIAETPSCRKWWAHMHDIMQTNPDYSPIMEDLKEVFHLD